MTQISGRLVESGVDWITATGKSRSSQLKLQDLGESLIRSEKRAGNEMRHWGFSGYQGFKCGSVQVGSRHDSCCIRLGSNVASGHWKEVYHAAENFSRVDVQLSLKMDRDVQQVLGLVYRQASRHSARMKRGPQVTLLRCNNGSSTVYLGQRQSSRFGRAYDKGAESGLDYYRGVLRFEQEIKGALCLPLLRELSRKRSAFAAAADECRWFFRERGVSLAEPAATFNAISVSGRQSDCRRRLTWLEKQVRPSIKLLIENGYYDEVVKVCGLDSAALAAWTRPRLVKAS